MNVHAFRKQDGGGVRTDRDTRLSPGDTSWLTPLTTTVPREYVHRASLAEVFLTSCTRVHEARFVLTGQWPRAHTFFLSADGRRHDPMQIAETLRQVGLHLAHAEFDVPLGHHFIMWDMSFVSRVEHLGVGRTPSDLDLEATCVDVVRRRGKLVEFRLVTSIKRDGRLVANGGGHFTCVSEAMYRRLRGSAPAATHQPGPYQPGTLPPSDFGRTLPRDVVLAPGGAPNRWRLNADTSHPILFDHDGDHMPGMVLLEAARQAACALLPPGSALLPATVSTEFKRYVEFTSPCWIEASGLGLTGSGTFHAVITGRQDDDEVFTARISGPVVHG
ncbi:ScbA/BarX family gamma-butyrolactone biosynthesis protein [Streptomyces sp. NPDC094021]|uniref:ScbA/BarX family gamma-butyrolactone biosynthesis protein n=1 Tax=Streptomyces sp. NPDC094021 TaxID=3366054 RepID=UPI00380A743E